MTYEEECLVNYNKFSLENLSWISNRRFSQTCELFVLCGCNFNTLLSLEAKLKRHVVFATPTSKEEVYELLKVNDFHKDFEFDNPRDKMLSVMGYKVNKIHGLHEKVV
jgi:hypothetical protein